MINIQINSLILLEGLIERVIVGEEFYTLYPIGKPYADVEIEIWIEEMMKSCTSQMRYEAKYYVEQLNIREFLMHLAYFENLSKIQDVIALCQKLDAVAFQELLEKAILSQPEDQEALTNQYREGIQEFIEDFEMMKTRLIHFIQRFYEKIYQGYEARMLMKLEVEKVALEKYYEQDPEAFIKSTMRFQTEKVLKGDIQPVLYLSACVPLQMSYSYEERIPDEMMILFGYGFRQFLITSKASELGEQVVKLLGEDTKLEIIKALAKKPLYASEIGKELNLNRATIAHHLNKLVSARIINITESVGTKIYYQLDLPALKKSLESFVLMLEAIEKEGK